MKKISGIVSVFLFITLFGSGVLVFASTVSGVVPFISNTDLVEQDDTVYSGRTSYQGNNTANAGGDKSGSGTVRIREIKNLQPNEVVCTKSGALGTTSWPDLSCNGTASDSNSQTEGEAVYTNLVGSTNLRIDLID